MLQNDKKSHESQKGDFWVISVSTDCPSALVFITKVTSTQMFKPCQIFLEIPKFVMKVNRKTVLPFQKKKLENF